MKLAKSAVGLLVKTWYNQGINKDAKVKIMKILVFSIFLHGCEALSLKAREKIRIEAVEPCAWRRMLGISRQELNTNISVLEEKKGKSKSLISQLYNM